MGSGGKEKREIVAKIYELINYRKSIRVHGHFFFKLCINCVYS